MDKWFVTVNCGGDEQNRGFATEDAAQAYAKERVDEGYTPVGIYRLVKVGRVVRSAAFEAVGEGD